MIKTKKIIFFIIKATFTILLLLTLVLFFYSAFFYKSSSLHKKTTESQITKEEEKLRLEEEKLRLEEEVQKKIRETEQKKTKIKKIKTKIKDGLYATVGNKAITKSDIVNEIKKILILNQMTYSDDISEKLKETAVKSTVKRSIKEIEIANYNDAGLRYNPNDLRVELNKLAKNINVDLNTLKKMFVANELDFSILENQIKTELLWNSLIFYLYRNRVTVNLQEIDEQLKLKQNKKEVEEYLISEIVVKPVEQSKIKSKIEEIKNRIKTEGFENVAMNSSISQTAVKGGDLGWLNENLISAQYRGKISNLPIGGISEPIFIKEGILFFQLRDKRSTKIEIDLVELKDQLVNSEKTKILNMHSKSHYNNLQKTITVKFFNE